jgi:mannosyl-oligosaccharide alpha-1,2-mannosidase
MRGGPLLCFAAALFSHLVTAGKVQYPGLKLPEYAQEDRANVVQIFKDSYDPYVKLAFPHDDLTPVSKHWTGWRPLFFPAIF